MKNDIRLAFRLLRKSPGFTAVAVLTLALGIGANTAIFAVVRSVLLRPLPFHEPARLAAVDLVGSNKGQEFVMSWSYPRFTELRRWNPAFEAIAGFRQLEVTLTGTETPERLQGELVSAEYFPILGIQAAQGRTFVNEEDRTPGTHPVIVLGHDLWKRRFGGRTDILGSTVHLNRIPFSVIGVMPEGFRGIAGNTEVWTPLMMAPALYNNPRRLQTANSFWLQAVARLRHGISFEQAANAVQAIQPELEKAHPSPRQTPLRTRVISLLDAKIDPAIRRSLLILAGAVGFVLLIAGANLANLLIGRAASRRKEVAVRLALGASRGAVIRQFLAESTLLSLLGGTAGVLLAGWSLDLLTTVRPETGGRGMWRVYARLIDRDAIIIDAWVLLFTLAASLGVGLIFGLLPAWQISRSRILDALKSSISTSGWGLTTGGLRRLNPRSVLMVAEIALAVVLLAGAGLMTASLRNLWNTPLGFESGNVLTFRLDLPTRQYTQQTSAQFFERLSERIQAMPGVSAAAVTNSLPVSGQMEVTVIGIGNEEWSRPTGVHFVGPRFFEALRIPLRQGRLLADSDHASAPRVAVLNETAAREFFGNENPIGKVFRSPLEEGKPIEVVGVAADVKYDEIQKKTDPDIYISYRQWVYQATYVTVRAAGRPESLTPAIRAAVAELDQDVPVFAIRTMEEREAAATSQTRFSASVLGLFAGIALALAAIGIYGVVSHSVAARTREIGIRVALGARPGAVLRAVLRDGMILALAGLAIGIPAALGATRVLSNFLYGVTATDPLMFSATSLLLSAVALAATYVPARRATRVDPMVALRDE